MWIRWTRGCEELSFRRSEEGRKRVPSDEDVLSMRRERLIHEVDEVVEDGLDFSHENG